MYKSRFADYFSSCQNTLVKYDTKSFVIFSRFIFFHHKYTEFYFSDLS